MVNLSTTWTSLVTNGLLATSDQLSLTLQTTICISDKFRVYLPDRKSKKKSSHKIVSGQNVFKNFFAQIALKLCDKLQCTCIKKRMFFFYCINKDKGRNETRQMDNHAFLCYN